MRAQYPGQSLKNVFKIYYLAIFIFTAFQLPTAQAAIDITLLGPPGSGKGTVGDELTRKLGLPRVSAGDLVRAEVAADTAFGKAVKAVTEGGGLIEDRTTLGQGLLDLLKHEISKPKYANGVIFDGYPRTQWQAQELEKMLGSMGRKISLAPQLAVPKSVLLERVQGRLICKNCAISFHKTLKPPKTAGVCDRCCQQLSIRADDNLEVLEKRLNVYEAEVAPLVNFYKERGVLKEIDGAQGSDKVVSEIQSVIDPKGLLERNFLQGFISTYPGPKPDVPRMYNIVEIYEHPELFRSLTERIAEMVATLDVDYIAAPEARGWPMAGAVSFLTNKPMISIRKQGKLPRGAELAKKEYGTAYSNDAIEMILKPEYKGKKAVIIDDGNSTGGTALAVKELLEQAGVTSVGIVTMIQYHYKKPQAEYLKWLENGGFAVSYYDLGL